MNHIWIWRAPVAGALLAGTLLAGGPVDAASHWVVSEAGGSAALAHARSKPTPPAAPSATCVASTQKKVATSWAAVSHAKTYTVWESKNSGTYSGVATVTTPSWTSGTLSAGTYTFEVSATFGTHWAGTRSSASATRTIATTGTRCK